LKRVGIHLYRRRKTMPGINGETANGSIFRPPLADIRMAKGDVMQAKRKSTSPLANWVFDAVTHAAILSGRFGPLRRPLADYVEKKIRSRADRPVLRNSLAVEQDKISIGLSMLSIAERSMATGRLGRPALKALLRNLYGNTLVRRGGEDAKAVFRAQHGQSPPDFLVISPGKACNLRCEGCYANSGANKEKLTWPVVERLVSEAYEVWGTRFFTFSGGEPLAYKDDGKGVLDLAERFPDCFFVMYTNGTLINDKVAKRMGKLGNVSPGLSVEGMKEATDARRGEGVFDKVVAAMDRLRSEGVIYGISLTPTRRNADEIMGDEVIDFFFGEMGALIAWVFHYMPMGRAFTLDLMPTAEQRLRLFERAWELVRERHLFIADFWNSATCVNGCVAAGRAGGYFHVNWNGDVSPCVFCPYAAKNVNEVFAGGGTLEDVWTHPFFGGIRDWQRDYGFKESNEDWGGSAGNMIAPCMIRDHHREFREIMDKNPDVWPCDEEAGAALLDPEYKAGLEKFGEELEALTGPMWREQYLKGPGIPAAPMKRV
jgi:MoaA/NifB/PqqE/SkfB family radical SAM enzyme